MDTFPPRNRRQRTHDDPQSLADVVALTRELRRLQEQERRRRIIMETVAAIGREIAASHDENAILSLIVEKAVETIPMDAGALFLADQSTRTHRAVVAHNLSPQDLRHIFFPFDEGVPGWATRNRCALLVPDASVDDRVHPRVRAVGVRSVLSVPLIVKDEVIGALNFFSMHKSAFAADDVTLAEIYADQVSIFIYNGRLLDALHQDAAALERRVEERTRALRQTQAQVVHAETLAATGRLAASLAHEINNPLQAVLLHLQTLREASGVSAQPTLQIIEHEVARVVHIVHRLLDLQHAQVGRRRPTCLRALLDEVIALIHVQCRQANVHVAIEQEEDLPRLWVDADQMKQIFLNLLLNALDAMPAGGWIYVSFHKRADRLEISLRDTGAGMTADVAARIFDPFFSTKPFGTGLGLSVSREIVAAHGGDLQVTSQPGGGARFTLRLPLDDRETNCHETNCQTNCKDECPLEHRSTQPISGSRSGGR